MTLPNRIFELSTEDEFNADGDLKAELAAYRADKLDAKMIQQRRANFQYRTEKELEALGEDKLVNRKS